LIRFISNWIYFIRARVALEGLDEGKTEIQIEFFCWMAGTIKYFYRTMNSSGERDSIVVPSNMEAFT
jgi:hypothetical protein